MGKTLMFLLVLVGVSYAQDEQKAPWRTDVKEARELALKEGKPCVLILNVDAGAC